MNEKPFRLCIIVLLTIFVVGVLFIGNRLAEQLAQSAEQLAQSAEQRAENGRHMQFDLAKASRPQGATTVRAYESWVIDTRTGEVTSKPTPRLPSSARSQPASHD